MASSVLGQMVIKVTGDATQFDNVINATHKRFSTFGGKMKSISLGISAALIGIGAAALKASADMEKQQTAFTTMLGSAEKAKILLGELETLGAKTPLQLESLTQNANVLLQYGISAEKVTDTLRMLGDVAQGDAGKLGSMTLAFSQISAAGRANMMDIRQMINAGFNPLKVISEKTGESMLSLSKRVSEGKVSVDEINEAFRIATSEGGRFFNAMEAQSKTFAGRMSTLQDSIMITARKLGDMLLPVAGELITVVSKLVDEIAKNEEFFNALSGAISKIGEIISQILPVISKLLTALAPIIAAVANLAANLVDALFPILELVADIFADLSPVITVIVDLISAVVGVVGKLIAALVKIIQPLLKPLLSILKLIEPILKPMIKAFEEFAKILESDFGRALQKTIELLLRFSDPLSLIYEGLKAIGVITEEAMANQGKLGKITEDGIDHTISARTAEMAKIEEQKKAEEDAADAKERINNKIASQREHELELIKTISLGNKNAVKEERESFEERAAAWNRYTTFATNAVGNMFSAMGEAIATGKNGWLAFGKAAVESLAAVIDALGNEALVQAAKSLAEGIAATAQSIWPPNPIAAAAAASHYAAAAAWGAAGAAAKLAAGIVSGLASNIKLAEGGLVMARPGGTRVIMAEAGVPEFAVPDKASIWNMIADRISSNIGNTTYNTVNNNNLPGKLMLNVNGNELGAELSRMSRNGKFIVDPNRGIGRG